MAYEDRLGGEGIVCPPPQGLTPVGLLALLGLGDRGALLRRRLAEALASLEPERFRADSADLAEAFGEQLLALISDETGLALFNRAASLAEADVAPAERKLDLDAAIRRRAFAALEEAAPAHAAALRRRPAPGPSPLDLAQACSEVALWSEAALLLWRLAAEPDIAHEAAALAARHPPLAEALPDLAARAAASESAGRSARRRLFRLMGFAEDEAGPLLPPAAALAPRIESLGAERLARLPPDWRDRLAGLDAKAGDALAQALSTYERATLAWEAKETALREAALAETLDLIAIEAALAEARRAAEAREASWREVLAKLGAA